MGGLRLLLPERAGRTCGSLETALLWPAFGLPTNSANVFHAFPQTHFSDSADRPHRPPCPYRPRRKPTSYFINRFERTRPVLRLCEGASAVPYVVENALGFTACR